MIEEFMRYWTRHGKLAMMGKNGSLSDSELYFYKNKSNIISFDINLKFKENTTYSYISEKDFLSIPKNNISSKYSLIQTISKIDDTFLSVKGSTLREFRETKNKYDKLVTIKKSPNSTTEILELIELWDRTSGIKYGWQKHSGYDRSFFVSHYENEKDKLQGLFFYINDKLVGYSIISLEKEDEVYVYMLRKNDTSYRNLCLYIDFISFETLYRGSPIFINWGASSGGVLKYKEKFPTASQEKLYFFKLNTN